MNDILTTDEVADLLQCEVTTVEEKLRQGELPGVKFGRSWMCPRLALLDTLNQQANANLRLLTPVAAAVAKQRGRKRAAIPTLA